MTSTLDSENKALKNIVYVYSVSAFNLPGFESCLIRRPRTVVLVVSNDEKIKEGAVRFRRVLEEEPSLKGIEVVRLDSEQQFEGEDLASIQSWIQAQLLPYLDDLSEKQADETEKMAKVCNLTGGTKLMSVALLTCGIEWDWLDYRGHNPPFLSSFNFVDGVLSSDEASVIKELPSATPLQVARLYSEAVRTEPNNPLENLEAAQNQWDALVNQDPAILALFKGLEEIWVAGRDTPEFKRNWLKMSSQTLVGRDTFTAEEQSWLKHWLELAEIKNISEHLTEHQAKLPGNKGKGESKNLQRWIMGDWIESLVHHWLSETFEKTEENKGKHVLKNVRVVEHKSGVGDRETDILFHHERKTALIEIKAYIEPGRIKDALEQIKSIGNLLGRTQKVLFLGPQFKHELDKNEAEKEKFELRCKAANVQYAFDRESLIQVLKS